MDSDIQELLEAHSRIEVRLAEKVQELSARRDHQALGYPSPTAYLMHKGNLSAGRARRIVADAHATERAVDTHRA